MNLQEGATLRGGKYTIVKELGSGAFGITYLATMKAEVQGPLGRMEVPASICIKEFFMRKRNSRGSDSHSVIGTNGEDWEEYRKRFRKEAENLTMLDHPNIVKVLDVFDENNTTYFVMQYVEGENLNNYLKRNHPLNESEAVDIILSVGEALQYMHDRRILHLDLKPGNIMRSKEGKIYLIDFGLSKQFTDDGNQATTTSPVGLGTPGYAPIEQNAKKLKEGEFTPTIDVYALGAVFFKLLTCTTPPEASDVANDGLPIEQLNECNRSQYLIDAIKKAMAPLKRDRYQNVDKLINELNSKNNRDETIIGYFSVNTVDNYSNLSYLIAEYERNFGASSVGENELMELLMEEDDKYGYHFMQKAYHLIEYLAKLGNANAQFLLGRMYEFGYGTICDDSIAKIWYDKALNNYKSISDDSREDTPTIANALYNIGEFYINGYLEDYDDDSIAETYYKRAYDLYLQSQDSKFSLFRLGDLDRTGYGRNEKEAMNWLNKSINKGSINAIHSLATIYLCQEDNKTALMLYRESANLGKISSMNMLLDFDITAEEKYKLISKICENGSVFSRLSIVQHLILFDKRDIVDIVDILNNIIGLCAKSNNKDSVYIEAHYWLGYHLYYHENDTTHAVEYLTIAAECGHVNSQEILGDIYYFGLGGIKRDKEVAQKWYEKAASQGDESAKKMLEKSEF